MVSMLNYGTCNCLMSIILVIHIYYNFIEKAGILLNLVTNFEWSFVFKKCTCESQTASQNLIPDLLILSLQFVLVYCMCNYGKIETITQCMHVNNVSHSHICMIWCAERCANMCSPSSWSLNSRVQLHIALRKDPLI